LSRVWLENEISDRPIIAVESRYRGFFKAFFRNSREEQMLVM